MLSKDRSHSLIIFLYVEINSGNNNSKDFKGSSILII